MTVTRRVIRVTIEFPDTSVLPIGQVIDDRIKLLLRHVQKAKIVGVSATPMKELPLVTLGDYPKRAPRGNAFTDSRPVDDGTG